MCEETAPQATAAALIRRILAGEKNLFHELIRPHERGFFLLAHSILHHQDDAEEAVQQAMLHIFTHLAELRTAETFKPWAMRVVENEAKMIWRKRRRRLYQPLHEDSGAGPEEKRFSPRQFADWRDLPSDLMEQQEIRDAVARGLAKLPEIYREVFILRDVQHFDVAETMAALDIGESAVKTRLHRARLMLRESLTPYFAKPKSPAWTRWKGLNPWLAVKR